MEDLKKVGKEVVKSMIAITLMKATVIGLTVMAGAVLKQYKGN
jgi:hypothetical protein